MIKDQLLKMLDDITIDDRCSGHMKNGFSDAKAQMRERLGKVEVDIEKLMQVIDDGSVGYVISPRARSISLALAKADLIKDGE